MTTEKLTEAQIAEIRERAEKATQVKEQPDPDLDYMRECNTCGVSLFRKEECEWYDDPTLNICHDCAAEQLEAARKDRTDLLRHIEAQRKEIKQLGETLLERDKNVSDYREAAEHYFHCVDCAESFPCREGRHHFEKVFGHKYGEDATPSSGGREG